MRIQRLLSVLLPAFVAAVFQLSAQPVRDEPGGSLTLVDGVAAVVGNEVILISEVRAQAVQQAQVTHQNPEDPAFLRGMLEAMISEKLLLARAAEDSIVISDEQLGQIVDRQYALLLERCRGSVACLEQTYAMPVDKIQRELRALLKDQALSEEVRRRRVSDMKVTDRDVQEFFSIYRDSIPEVPEQVELQRIVLVSKPTTEAREAAVNLARTIIDSINAGGDFADFARRYSADPGSAPNGGDVGFVEKGRFVVEYEEAARRLALNEISPPVQSPFGIHIIQVLGRQGEKTHSRHILLPIAAGDRDRDSLIAFLVRLRDSVAAGGDFAELARRHSHDPETRGLGGLLGKIPLESLPATQRADIEKMKVGDVTEPLATSLSPTENGFQIIRLSRRIPKHAVDLSEDRVQIERLALLYKQNKDLATWVEQLRKEIFWDIKYVFR